MDHVHPQMFIDEHENINNDATSSSPDADDLIELTSQVGLQKKLQMQ